MKRNKISLIIPVRNEEKNLDILINKLGEVMALEEMTHFDWEILVNDNASTDNSSRKLNQWSNSDKRVLVTTFPENVGFQGSLIYGMKIATGECVIVLQSDLQDPPELIPRMISFWKSGSKIVCGVIKERSEGFISNSSRTLFYRILRASSDKKIIVNFQDFYILDRSVYQSLGDLPLEDSFLRSEIMKFEVEKELIYYKRNPRLQERTNFGFAQKWDLAVSALLLNFEKASRYLTMGAIVLGAIGIITIVFLLSLRFVGVDFGAPGWLSSTTLVLLLGSLNFTFFGITIEYLFRIHRRTRKLDSDISKILKDIQD
jgi:dolichol-phosphate mannosyltransferase